MKSPSWTNSKNNYSKLLTPCLPKPSRPGPTSSDNLVRLLSLIHVSPRLPLSQLRPEAVCSRTSPSPTGVTIEKVMRKRRDQTLMIRISRQANPARSIRIQKILRKNFLIKTLLKLSKFKAKANLLPERLLSPPTGNYSTHLRNRVNQLYSREKKGLFRLTRMDDIWI